MSVSDRCILGPSDEVSDEVSVCDSRHPVQVFPGRVFPAKYKTVCAGTIPRVHSGHPESSWMVSMTCTINPQYQDTIPCITTIA